MSLASSIALSAGDSLLSVWSASESATNFAWQRASRSGTSFHSSNNGNSWRADRAGNNAWNISNDSVTVPEPDYLTLYSNH